MARGIPSSPRRSNRGGHAKGKKQEEEDDGGQTRCVCNQEHHEGVMIQCETCKVWQHCPCVGLGDGEVTPDKYYCDSCRPQNHPYRVQNGMLISNSKKSPQMSSTASALKTKSPKKRNTMNSKDASIPLDFTLAQQKWEEEGQGDAENAVRGSKRRRKTESTTDDEDEARGLSALKSPQDSSTDTKDQVSAAQDQEAPSASASTSATTSPKTNSAHFKNAQSPRQKKNSTKASYARSRSNSPSTNTHPFQGHGANSNTADISVSASASSLQNGNGGGRQSGNGGSNKNARHATDDEQTNGFGSAAIVPSTKRRKVTKAEAARSESVEDTFSPSIKKEFHEDRKELAPRSRKNGTGTRVSHKRQNAASDPEEHHEESVSPTPDTADPTGQTTQSSSRGSAASIPPPPPTTMTNHKKGASKRGHNNHRSGSRQSTPVPNGEGGGGEGTPQPMPPSPPATVKYPSAKMTIQDMSKRAKQLLDYIGRVQVDMADRKTKSVSNTPKSTVAYSVLEATGSLSVGTTMVADEVDCKGPVALSVSVAATESSESIHGDNQVCPGSARSSIDGPPEISAGGGEFKGLSTKRMSLTMTSLVESESPLGLGLGLSSSAQESMASSRVPGRVLVNGFHGTNDAIEGSGSKSGNASQEPLVPTRVSGATGSEPMQMDSAVVAVSSSTTETAASAASLRTSLDLMDKLTGDLIRFQERFGAHC